ncbi:MAG: EAL domain-containing protein [Actinobacteria bacterium]|nr:EAL domain-containing protein [Actinomycetota bacterium]
MGAWITPTAVERFRRHLPELVVVLGVIALLHRTGLVVDQPAWLVPLLLVLGAGVISAAYSRWGTDADAAGIRLRALVQVWVLTVITYATGWGFALAMVQLFAVADNVKYSGSRAVRPVLGWAVAGIVVGQLAIVAGLLPSAIDPTAGHTLAVFSALVLVLVGGRIGRMTVAKEEVEAELSGSETRFRSLVQQSSDVIMVIGGAQVTYVSPSVSRVMGYGEDEVLGNQYLDLVHPDDRQSVVDFVVSLMDTPGATGLIECRLLHADGRWITFESNCHNLLHDPQIAGFVTTGRDISDRKALESELEHRAFHDALTGLANRALFRDRVEHTLARSGRETDLSYGVLYVDLDSFKAINDTLGHAVGDGVLNHVADLLRECIRDVDTAARLGGDEFAILLDGMKDQSGAARVASRILEGLKRPVTIRGHEVQVDASIGIAIAEPGQDAETFLRNADIAMYMAKSAGKGTYEIFEPSMHLQVVERLTMEADLQHAVDRGEFVLHYQPIVELTDGTIRGVEALVRWNHPERGMVSPAEFIPLAEETGLIIPMGRWILREACRQVTDWQTRFDTEPPLSVSVNVSMRQFSHGDIVRDVREALEESGLAPGSLTLELTESALVQDTDATIRLLRQLKALGVRLAVDDFGTGYSSLAYLQRFPLDVLKIDRSFVEGMVNGSQSPALVRAIVEIGHSLQLETVAEGIEHDEELTQFRALHCSLGQGYLFARPGAHDTIEHLIAERARVGVETILIPEAVVELPADAKRGS